jgi:hypothetical protein
MSLQERLFEEIKIMPIAKACIQSRMGTIYDTAPFGRLLGLLGGLPNINMDMESRGGKGSGVAIQNKQGQNHQQIKRGCSPSL